MEKTQNPRDFQKTYSQLYLIRANYDYKSFILSQFKEKY